LCGSLRSNRQEQGELNAIDSCNFQLAVRPNPTETAFETREWRSAKSKLAVTQ